MKRRKKLILTAAYILTFAAALALTCFYENQGLYTQEDVSTQELPALYISDDTSAVNLMQAYTVEMEGIYLWDSICVLSTDGELLLGLYENGHEAALVTYSLCSAQDGSVLETGSLTQTSDGSWRMNIARTLTEGSQYCLSFCLTDTLEETYYFYTRAIYGDSYALDEKLALVWDFHEMTLDADRCEELEKLLGEDAGTYDDSSYTSTSLVSEAQIVMWGSLSPTVTTDIITQVLSVGEETASIRLYYEITVTDSAEEERTFFVDEYYTVRYQEETFTITGFTRSLTELTAPDSAAADEDSDLLRLGIMDEESVSVSQVETDSGSVYVFSAGGCVWYYDEENNLMTCLYGPEETADTMMPADLDLYEISILGLAQDGTVCFAVYGYLPYGTYAGQNGIAVYSYDPETNTTTDLAFIRSAQDEQILILDAGQLSCVNSSGQLYFCLDDTLWRFDYDLGVKTAVFSLADSEAWELSADGSMLAVADASGDILVYYLETDETMTISADQEPLQLIGYIENDLIYGVTVPSLTYTDADQSSVVPLEGIYIVDSTLTQIRAYVPETGYVTDVVLGDSVVNISLAEITQTDDGVLVSALEGDFLIYTQEQDETSLLTTVYDENMHNELYIEIDGIEEPLCRSAQQAVDGSCVFVLDDPDTDVEKYYVFSLGDLVASYTDLAEAITYCIDNTGQVFSTQLQMLWEDDAIGSDYLIDFPDIWVGDSIETVVEALRIYAVGDSQITVDDSMTMFEALQANLTDYTVVNLTGLTLEDIFYFVSNDRPVVVMLSEGEYLIIVGFNSYYMQIANPSSGEISDWNYSYYSAVFEEQGNVFFSYY